MENLISDKLKIIGRAWVVLIKIQLKQNTYKNGCK